MQISVIGAGTWGTAIASLAAISHPTRLWVRRPDLAEQIRTSRRNQDYLPELELSPKILVTDDMEEALKGCDLVLVAVPSHGFRKVFSVVSKHLSTSVPVTSLTKGIEVETCSRMTEIIAELQPGRDPRLTGVLTGPNLAHEILKGEPTAAVAAFSDPDVARTVQDALMGPAFRIYTNGDVVGCELAGCIKNVLAIAIGMARGLGFGSNTMATLITRALAEETRLGVSLGGRPETFAGLAGMGDLIATCQSSKSRNSRVGFALASGKSLSEILEATNTVAEGVNSVRPILELSKRMGAEMPIAEQVGLAIEQGVQPTRILQSLMSRGPKPE